MASGVAGHFTRDTLTLVTMLARGSTLRYVANPRRVNPALQRVEPFAGPLVLLVDAGTASTSEFFAGGLQAAKRAVVVGDTTAGMALPALTAALPFGDRLMHAIADARLPTGTALDGRGVIPDVVVTIDRRRLAMGQDPEFLVAAIVAASRARMARGPAPTAPPAPPTARPVPPATSRTGPG
jgi:carboxyl-terminal processing protease